jgi:hypothetical protein
MAQLRAEEGSLLPPLTLNGFLLCPVHSLRRKKPNLDMGLLPDKCLLLWVITLSELDSPQWALHSPWRKE